jgi:hypothetical protein
VENHRNKKIKFLRSDRGGEYLSYEFGLHLKQCGIVSQLTPPGTPQRNGVSERRNRTLLDMVRSIMSLTDLPLSFWGYALETAAFTLNRAPSKSVETTPYELWFGDVGWIPSGRSFTIGADPTKNTRGNMRENERKHERITQTNKIRLHMC